jgi:hypothetical protein
MMDAMSDEPVWFGGTIRALNENLSGGFNRDAVLVGLFIEEPYETPDGWMGSHGQPVPPPV